MDEAPPKKAPPGIPAWVMTFADLMSLLMCFFVLLLSFSEMDAQKFKRLAGSMRNAFGVQRDVTAHEIPKGISIIAKEFSPGKPEDTLLNHVRQNTTDDYRKRLDMMKTAIVTTSRKMAQAMEEEIKLGQVEVETEPYRVVIRILEKGAFESGYADIKSGFSPVLKKMANVFKTLEGQVSITGHTDDIPISTNRFRSNWDLSSARAASVAHALLEESGLERRKFKVIGYADTKPLVPNDSEANRSKNRRVDIIIEQDDLSRAKVKHDGARLKEALKDSNAVEVTNNQKKTETQPVDTPAPRSPPVRTR